MILRLLVSAVLLCIPLSSAEGQSSVGEWRHYTSTISPQALDYYEGRVFAATGGGVLVYDPHEDTFSTLAIADGLIYTDLTYLTIAGDWMLLGGAPPQGIIQAVNLNTGKVDVIDLGLDEILRIAAGADRGFAAFRQGQDLGIMELKWNGQGYRFADTYRNFPSAVTKIVDLDLWGDSLFVTTNFGVIGNDHVQANLKDPATWQMMTPERTDIIQYLVDSTGHYFMVPYELHHRAEYGWQVHRTFGGGDLYHLTRRQNGDFVISYSRYLRFLTKSGGLFGSQQAGGRVSAYIDGDNAMEGYAIIRDQGLARYHHRTRSWTSLAPNTLAGNDYTAVLKLATGELVAAGKSGVARYNGQSWYNLIPGYSILSGPDDDRIHGNALLAESRYFLADTIFYRGKQSWNLLQLPNGELLVGFKGNYPMGGGILQVNVNDVADYFTYDTTDGRLDGLADDGYITIRHMALDAEGNVWIANPFCELRQDVLAVYTTETSWTHFSTSDSYDKLNQAPTEIAFDREGRVWIGSEVREGWGTGGIAVLDHGGTLGDKSDDQWILKSIRLEADHSNTVWSLIFDHNQVLWTVSPDGVMGYLVGPELTLSPFTDFGPYLSDVPFIEGSKIRVDAQNNKWITTPQHGLWVLLDNTTFWPSVEGLNSSNSTLPTDEILDVYLDNDEGVAYLATTKGISALKIPFREELKDYSGMVIFPSPYRIPSEKALIIDGLRQGSSVKVFTATGRLVRELSATDNSVQGYQAAWDGRNSAGEWVGSGVYLVTGYLPDGKSGVGKVAVIRR
ncbi:MAG: hypothetical protein JSU77_01645 [Fidelibacterota bacterium]|nr:MAG: hypothetical protein JSU77_01645 [Candidatus Neomarinimicrobiota bacterium]